MSDKVASAVARSACLMLAPSLPRGPARDIFEDRSPCGQCGGMIRQWDLTKSAEYRIGESDGRCAQWAACGVPVPEERARRGLGPLEFQEAPVSEAESKSNGQSVIRIGRKGKRLIALGDSPPRELDVVVVHNQWVDVDRQFRDPEGKVPPERWTEWTSAAYAFAVGVFGDDSFTQAEALEFLNVLRGEVVALRPFFEPKSSGGPPSPGSTELRFSP